MKKLVAVITSAILILSMAVTSYAATGFTDVAATNWAYGYIDQLITIGGINGYPDGKFKPQNSITAAEFVKITVSLLEGTKSPTGTHWASGYMQAATDLRIIPESLLAESDWNKPIPRYKMGIIMELSASMAQHEIIIEDTDKLNTVKTNTKDFSNIPAEYRNHIASAICRGLITGYPDGSFGPNKTATRAEASAMIIRLIDETERIYPATTKSLEDLIKNPEFMPKLDGITKYIYDTNVNKYNLSYEVVKGTTFLVVKDLYVLGLIKDGKIIEQAATIPMDSTGNRVATVDTDITTIDYILSYDNAAGDVIVIPNPLKK